MKTQIFIWLGMIAANTALLYFLLWMGVKKMHRIVEKYREESIQVVALQAERINKANEKINQLRRKAGLL